LVSDRRSEERYQIRKKVLISSPTDQWEKVDAYLSRNISSKGILVELDGSGGFEVGQAVHLEIDLGRLEAGDKPVHAVTRGRVVRREADGMAIVFNGRSNLVQK
jgi:hypothetical protein